MEKAKDLIGEILDSAGRITIAQVRDLFKTSRKCARQILDYTDRIGLTKKEGAETERVKNR
nr:SelB C-terminal domain-containing protein [Mediterraneibacter glycyrrhizinilyticus]